MLPEIGDDTFDVVDNVGDKLLVETNHNAPNGRVVLVDPQQPAEANWKTILPEKPEPLQGVSTAGGKLFATYLKDVTTRAYVYSLDGTLENEVELPGPGQRRRLRRQHATTRSCSTRSTRSTCRRRSTATTSRRRRARSSAQPKVPGYDPTQFETEAGLLHEQGRHDESRCSSCTRRA